MQVLDLVSSQPLLHVSFKNLGSAFPAFARARNNESWGGMLDATPDTMPVLLHVEALPGFHIATGFSGHCFGIGPGSGQLMAVLVTGDRPFVDPTPLALDRFGPFTTNCLKES